MTPRERAGVDSVEGWVVSLYDVSRVTGFMMSLTSTSEMYFKMWSTFLPVRLSYLSAKGCDSFDTPLYTIPSLSLPHLYVVRISLTKLPLPRTPDLLLQPLLMPPRDPAL